MQCDPDARIKVAPDRVQSFSAPRVIRNGAAFFTKAERKHRYLSCVWFSMLMALSEVSRMHASHNSPRSLAQHPVDVLREEHQLLLRVVDAMENESRDMLAGGRMEPEFWRRVVEFLEHYQDRLHHQKEESVLFPELARLGLARAVASVAALSAEHSEGRRAVRTILDALARRDVSRLSHAAIGFCRRERMHIAREEEQLLPACAEALSADQAARLAQAFEAHRETVDPMILARCEGIARFVSVNEELETFAN